MADLVLKNGKVVLPSATVAADLVIENGKIVSIDEGGYVGKTSKEIDCSGKFILPGCIDAHVHFRDPGLNHKEDFGTGSVAALAGGVTFVLDMPNTKPETITMEALEEKRMIAREKAKCGFGFQFGIDEEHFDQLKFADRDSDVYAFKAYMGESTGNMLTSYELLDRVFGEVTKPVTIHAEDQGIIKRNFEELKGSEYPQIHSEIRSVSAAAAAVKHSLHLAKKHDHKVHIAHVSSAAELEFIRKFRSDNVTCEVTPHHLFLNIHEYNRQGNFVKVNPPLRKREDRDALWEAIDEGIIDIIASDHAPHTFEEKDQAYSSAPSGVPGIETMLPLMLDQVNKGRLTINKVVKMMSRRPAEIFGIDGKGRIEVGFDADLVICDMEKEKEILNSQLITKCKWSPFNGWKLRGWPVMVVLGGSLLE